jgi:TolB protein
MDGSCDRFATRVAARRHVLPVMALFAAALTAVGGCATSSAPHSRTRIAQTTPTQRPATMPANRGISPGDEPSRVLPDFIGPSFSDGVGTRTTDGYDAALIGLYGELASPIPSRFSRDDGANNITQVTAVAEGACFQPSVSPDGTLLAFATTQHRRTADIFVRRLPGSTQTRITSDPADDMMPAFAPDGRRIAFASNRYGNWDIFVTTLDGGAPLAVTNDSDDELHPTWSPDGKMVAYCKLGAVSGRWEIWVVDLDRPSAPQFLEYGLFPDWNPDPGRNKIAFQRARERGSRMFSVWTIDYADGEALYPTEIVSAANAAVMHPAWSPDGSRIVFVTVIEPDTQPTGRPLESDLWVVDVDGTGRTGLTNGEALNLNPVWSRTGAIYFLSDRSGLDNIWAVETNRATDLRDPANANYATGDPDQERTGGLP